MAVFGKSYTPLTSQGVELVKVLPRKSSLVVFSGWLLFVAFCLNWIWEMVQMPTYVEMAGRVWWETVSTCTWATLGDVGLTFAIYGLGALAAGRSDWALNPKWNVYAFAAILGATCAVAIEWRALGSARWSYSDHMPVVPLLRVGMWPLLQLTILVPAALAIAAWLTRRNRV